MCKWKSGKGTPKKKWMEVIKENIGAYRVDIDMVRHREGIEEYDTSSI